MWTPLGVQPKAKLAQTPIEELGPHIIRASVDLRVSNKYMEQTRITQTSIDKDVQAHCLPLERSLKFFLEMGMPYNTMIVKTSQFQFARFRSQFGSIRVYMIVQHGYVHAIYASYIFIKPLYDNTILTMGRKHPSSRLSCPLQLAQN